MLRIKCGPVDHVIAMQGVSGNYNQLNQFPDVPMPWARVGGYRVDMDICICLFVFVKVSCIVLCDWVLSFS